MAEPAGGMLSPSAHVQLLQHYQMAHAKHPSLAVPTDLTRVHELAPTPQPQPSPQSNALGAVDPAIALSLPRGWSTLRASQLRLPCEKRMLSDLRIDTMDSHLLRRGLWIACASLYLPAVLEAEEVLSVAPVADSSVDSDANGQTVVPSISASSVPLEGVGDVRVPSAFQVSVVEGGITNQLYKVSLKSHPDQPVLVRIYGPRTELVIDRSKENDVVDVLSSNGEGPRIHGRFANGRLESWLVGKSLTPAQMRDPSLSALIAGRLSRLHRQRMPFDRTPVIGGVLRKWAAIAADVSFPNDAAKAALLSQLGLSAVIDATEAYINAVQASYFGGASPIVFAHNDLLSGNVMWDEKTNAVALVDFEYGNYNPRAFDFANHFCECCGFECDWSVFPTFTAQQHFLRAYIAALDGVPPASVSSDTVHAAYAEVQCWLLGPHLFWCLWAVVQARYSPIDFDYLSYALQRWKAFNDMKPRTDRWLAVKSATLDQAIDEEKKQEGKS